MLGRSFVAAPLLLLGLLCATGHAGTLSAVFPVQNLRVASTSMSMGVDAVYVQVAAASQVGEISVVPTFSGNTTLRVGLVWVLNGTLHVTEAASPVQSGSAATVSPGNLSTPFCTVDLAVPASSSVAIVTNLDVTIRGVADTNAVLRSEFGAVAVPAGQRVLLGGVRESDVGDGCGVQVYGSGDTIDLAIEFSAGGKTDTVTFEGAAWYSWHRAYVPKGWPAGALSCQIYATNRNAAAGSIQNTVIGVAQSSRPSNTRMSAGEIIGIVVGSAVGIGLLLGFSILLCKKYCRHPAGQLSPPYTSVGP